MRISDWSSDVCSSDLSIVVEENGRRESGYFGLGGRYMYDHLFEEGQWNRAIDEALAQALVNLRAVDAPAGEMTDRKSVVSGKSVAVRVELGGRRIIKKKTARII